MDEKKTIDIKSLAKSMGDSFLNEESIYEKISTGYRDLDLLMNNLKKSKLVVIAGRPSSGKSSLVYNLMYNVAKQNKKVLCFSLDANIKYVLNSLIAIDSKLSIENIDSIKFSSDEFELYEKSLDAVVELPIIFYDKVRTTCKIIESTYDELDEKPDIIFIDYLQLLSPINTNIIQNREQEISSIVRDLKLLANKLEITIVVTSQLSRALEDRVDKRPMLTDLRDSGAIEDSADIILFLYNTDYYNGFTNNSINTVNRIPVIEVIVAKNKRGKVGTVKLGFFKEQHRFVNVIIKE